jgi:hypothetical protein
LRRSSSGVAGAEMQLKRGSIEQACAIWHRASSPAGTSTPVSSASSRAAWPRSADTSSPSCSAGGSTEPPGSCHRPGAAVDADILAAITRPSSLGWTTLTNNDGSQLVLPGTRRRA